jgi:hypothetical protein
MAHESSPHLVRLLHTGCVFGHSDRGVCGIYELDSSQGKPERKDRERRMRRAAGNSSIQLLTFLLLAGGFTASRAEAQVTAKSQAAQIRAVGDAFEGLMLQRLYEQMRASNSLLAAGDDSPFAPGRGEEIFRGMRDEMMLKATAQRRPLGISDMVVRQLSGTQIPRAAAPVAVE